VDVLRSAEIDLQPIREAVRGGVVPAAAVAPVGAAAHVVDRRTRCVAGAVVARRAGDTAIAGQSDVDAAGRVDDLRQRGTDGAVVGGIAGVGGDDAVRSSREARRVARGAFAVGAAN